MKRVIRICEVRLENFKNTAYGVVKIPEAEGSEPFSYSSGILGIYGQNGSGKTAVIEALAIIKRLLSSGSLKDVPINHYIMVGRENCKIGVRFSIEQHSHEKYDRIYADYEVSLVKSSDGNGDIQSEVLKAERKEKDQVIRRTLVDYDRERDSDCFLPKYRYQALAKTKVSQIAISVAQRLAKKEKGSFVFSTEAMEAFRNEDELLLRNESEPQDFDCQVIQDALFGYANTSLFVVPSAHSAMIRLCENVPLNIRIEDDDEAIAGAIPLLIGGPEVVSLEYYGLLSERLLHMNQVLKEIIPGLTIGIHSYGAEMRQNGKEGVRIELTSQRGESSIPIRYESEGIIKMVTILNVLISAFTDASVCLVIDELDSGIFEYLLGELLTAMNDYGKGQIIFTSHNLRPLEVLDKSNAVFTTTNPMNRYIRMQYVKQNNNLRDLYLRSILLGGQKEELYEDTDTNQIARAFRHAGRMVRNGE